ALAARVHDAARMLGYRHNAAASALRRADGITASIGLILEDVANPFFSAVHRGIEDVARERGYLTFTGSSDEDPQRERGLAAAFAARNVDGLIIAPSPDDHGYLADEQAHGVRFVFVDRPPGFLDADTVVSDNRAGARAAVDQLVAGGHRRIGFIGDRADLFTAAERLAGYRDALAAGGLAHDPWLVRHAGSGGLQAGRAATELLAGPDPPTALFSAQNLITVEVVRVLHALGVHHAVAHVGFDDVTFGDLVEPAITVVAQDPREIGLRAAQLLFERLDGLPGRSRQVVVPTRMIRRGSGEIPPPGGP
ncbi:MAG: putative LacI-family transcriptional regulator, partial [uncultured Thermoleophilia bacterium]